MRLFVCQSCAQPLFFENTRCERCEHRLGYVAEQRRLVALDPAGEIAAGETPTGETPTGESWRPVGGDALYRFCANAAHDSCNWLVAAESGDAYCRACRHNRTIPDLGVPENLRRWRKLELAKHRLFYALLRLRLPLATRAEDPQAGLAFDFLADPPEADAPKIMTGHAGGIITVALNEADDAIRVERQQEMGETYRTLLGHFRHEVGHYYWERLVRDDVRGIERFRALFGDERADYAAALAAHYANGPPADWRDRFISAYAAAHPFEDFAESWAHYLHIVDALETARAFGLRVHPALTPDQDFHADVDFDPHTATDAAALIEAWLPLTFAINSINRSLGQPDLYPFVLTPPAIAKLDFVHGLVRDARQSGAAAPATAARRESA